MAVKVGEKESRVNRASHGVRTAWERETGLREGQCLRRTGKGLDLETENSGVVVPPSNGQIHCHTRQ